MDAESEEEYASTSSGFGESGLDSRIIRKSLIDIAQNKPNTNVSKAILEYEESPNLSNLLALLEEVSKNTKFSTDLRLSLSYYMDEFVRHVSGSRVPRRSVLAAAGNVLQYCSKIYGDRVEFMYQVVEQQIEALIIADPKKDGDGNNNSNGTQESKKGEEPRKRRVKKLVQKEFDPFSFKMEPKKFKVMSDEKRFSRAGFETNKNRNRTVEHMYQDHTPADLWKHAPIVDPANPFEKDEKKNYKLFTYHPEPRYNTLLPDISFKRLNLIKEHVPINQQDDSDCVDENMTNRDYLNKYIALENQMLASRFKEGSEAVVENEKNEEARLKRSMKQNTESAKKMKLIDEECDMEVDSDESLPTQDSLDSAMHSMVLGETSQEQLNISEFGEPGLSSTMTMNDSSCVDSTRLEDNLDNSEIQQENNCTNLLQQDSGIGMDDSSEHTAQSFDDEGVVLTDNIDERLKSLSPKVLVQDILPGVPDKANLSVHLDAEMLALSGLNEGHEEIVNAPRDVCFPIVRNILGLPVKKLRNVSIFKLEKDFDLFKQLRMPSKRSVGTVERPARKTVSKAKPRSSVLSLNFADLPLDQMEFDADENFRGFRRRTLDSGIDYEEIRAESEDTIVNQSDIVDIEELPNDVCDLKGFSEEIPKVRELVEERQKDDASLQKTPPSLVVSLPLSKLSNLVLNDMAQIEDIEDVPEENSFDSNAIESDPEESGLQSQAMEFDPNDIDLGSIGADWDQDDDREENTREYNLNLTKASNSIDEETDARILDWHRRLAPVLEASHERQNFNIRDLNDEIIAKCEEQNGEASLEDVMEDKDPTKLCCYMLSTLLLTNQGNVQLDIDEENRGKPLEPQEFKIKLISTERKAINPEDDIGNINKLPTPVNNASAKEMEKENANQTKIVKAVRRKAPEPESDEEDDFGPVNIKAVRLIKPVPRASAHPEDTDSGISLSSALTAGYSVH